MALTWHLSRSMLQRGAYGVGSRRAIVRSTSARALASKRAPSLTLAHHAVGTPSASAPSQRAPKHAPTSALRDADHPPAFIASRTAGA